ncbi:MAG: GIY-YIG nuclease family protein [Alphaproteobacteria bacterium]|nr:GIY-YIG nuclease family protein [Alphaproteobacteria bacterium]
MDRDETFVYVLGSFDGPGGPRTYVGWTTNLGERLAAHNAGKGAKSTRGRAWVLLYAERHQTRSQAMSREWHLKRDRTFRKGLLKSGECPRGTG